MAEINAKDVMKLRNSTGLPMMDCKQALTEANGDFDKAEELLRKKLKGKMESRMDRAAGEGRVAVVIHGNEAAIIELRAETDFTAKNENFVSAASKIAELACKQPAGDVKATPDMDKLIDNLRITTGENISLGRATKVKGDGVFGSYVHHDGKTGVLVQSTGGVEVEVLRKIGMHVTAAFPRPMGVRADEIPAAVVEKERKFRVEQAIESGKPKEIAEKMVEGGMRKFFEEIALLEQPYVVDPSKKVKELLPAGVTVTTFRRWQVGEES